MSAETWKGTPGTVSPKVAAALHLQQDSFHPACGARPSSCPLAPMPHLILCSPVEPLRLRIHLLSCYSQLYVTERF